MDVGGEALTGGPGDAGQRGTRAPGARDRSVRAVTDLERRIVAAGVFDALDAETSVIAPDGTIIAVNDAWERFGRANGAQDSGIGTNYFAVCEASTAPSAAAVLEGLRAVAERRRDSFRFDYPCHGPRELRWRRLTVNRFPGPGADLIVIRHDSVTNEKLAADARVERAQRRLQTVTDRMGDGLCTLDPHGRIIYVNPQGERLLQAGGIHAIGGSFVNRLVGTHPDGTMRDQQDVLIGADFDGFALATTIEDLLIRPDGSRLPIEYVVNPLPGEDHGDPDGWVVVFRDISERKRREKTVHERSEHATWMARIQRGLDLNQFVLFAQPIVDLATRRTVQHELLIRLDDPEEGLIAPGRFLPTAEAYGLAPTIDRWVIGRAFEIAALGHAIEVNLSAKSLTDPSLPHLIERTMDVTGADPSRIVFEITETALIENDTAACNFAHRVRAMGCRLALDDFGTGYSGFSYLKNLPVDLLKIDMEFVRDATSNPVSQHVITAVVSLAQAFGIRTVAEGVEDAETLALITDLGVNEAQGYFLGRPGPSEDLVLDTRDPTPT